MRPDQFNRSLPFHNPSVVGSIPTSLPVPIAHSRRRRATVFAIGTRWQEVRPMNAISAPGAPLQSTIARLN